MKSCICECDGDPRTPCSFYQFENGLTKRDWCQWTRLFFFLFSKCIHFCAHKSSRWVFVCLWTTNEQTRAIVMGSFISSILNSNKILLLWMNVLWKMWPVLVCTSYLHPDDEHGRRLGHRRRTRILTIQEMCRILAAHLIVKCASCVALFLPFVFLAVSRTFFCFLTLLHFYTFALFNWLEWLAFGFIDDHIPFHLLMFYIISMIF